MSNLSLVAVAGSIGLFALSAQAAAAQSYTFKTIDLSKVDGTGITAINDTNDLLAHDIPASGAPNCVLIDPNPHSKTIISDPSGVSTTCVGLNESQTIVGYYNTATDNAFGFVYSNGAYSDFVPPNGQIGVIPLAVSDNGNLVGYYYDTVGAHGFLLRNGVYTTYQIPSMSYVFPSGVNNKGQTTIQAIDASGGYHAFFKHGSVLTELVHPGWTLLLAERINNNGQMVGGYTDTAGLKHGYVYDSNTAVFYTIDFPGAFSTGVNGINDHDTLVGSYRLTSGGISMGFKAVGTLSPAAATADAN